MLRGWLEAYQKYLRINFQPFGCLLTIHLCDNTCTALCHRIGLIGPINCSTPKWVWHTCVLLHDINYLRKNEKLMIDWLIDWLIDFFPVCCTWIAQATFQWLTQNCGNKTNFGKTVVPPTNDAYMLYFFDIYRFVVVKKKTIKYSRLICYMEIMNESWLHLKCFSCSFHKRPV